DGARGRAGRRALHRLELRLISEGAYKPSESRLARGTHEAAGLRQSGIRALAGGAGAAAAPAVIDNRGRGARVALQSVVRHAAALQIPDEAVLILRRDQQ